ncbi:MAG: hypothetical protein ACR2NM_02620 [Bythopirellula sp.]
MSALGFFDYFIIAIIVSVFGGGAAAIFNAQDKARLARLEAKVDLLLDQAGLELDANAPLPEDVRQAIQKEQERAE